MVDKKESDFFQKINELLPTYVQVKEAIILAENFDPDRKVYIAPLNQLRSSLDHIFKSISHSNDLEYELKEAKEHIERAGYDAFEILASNLGTQIINRISIYDNDAITNVFRKYYTEIKPRLIQIKAELGEIRTRKKESKIDNVEKPFNAYVTEIKQLLKSLKEVESFIPSLEEYTERKKAEKAEEERKRKKSKLVDYIWTFIIGVGVGLLVWWGTYYFSNNKGKIENKEVTIPS